METSSGVNKLCNALLVLLQKKRLEDISVKELVLEAGVNRSTYNYHFYSIDEVLDKWIDLFTAGLLDTFKDFETENAKAVSGADTERKCLEYFSEHRSSITILYNAGYRLRFLIKIIDGLEDYLNNFVMTFRENGVEKEYSEGLVYELIIKEYCYSVGADLEFFLKYCHLFPLDTFLSTSHAVKGLYLTAVKPKKIK